jgi:hypothetical protein
VDIQRIDSQVGVLFTTLENLDSIYVKRIAMHSSISVDVIGMEQEVLAGMVCAIAKLSPASLYIRSMPLCSENTKEPGLKIIQSWSNRIIP